MTGLLVLALVPILAAAMFALRAIRERNARLQAERTLRTMQDATGQVDDARIRFLGIVAHELRSPLGAIMGYQELLADGIYGDIDERTREPLDRIGRAARQLLTLTDGMEELGGAKQTNSGGVVTVDLSTILQECLAEAEREAAGRGLLLDVTAPSQLEPLRTHSARARTILDLVVYAAIKLARAGALRVNVEQDADSTRLALTGTGLDKHPLTPHGEVAHEVEITSGAQLRLAIARRLAETIGVEIETLGDHDRATILIRFPPPADISHS